MLKTSLGKRFGANLTILSLLASMTFGLAAQSDQSISYDFNTAGELAAEFDSYVRSGNVTQSNTGGISNSGAISTNGGSADAVFASKDTYSLGGEGSSYTFTSYLQSVGNNGYSGMGFTSLTPSSGNASGTPYRPTDAIGISVHGGGFVFHNAGTDYSGSWSSNNSNIQTIKLATISDLLNSGSPSDWYYVKLVITRIAGDKFKMRVEIWSSNSDSSLIRPAEADSIFEITNLTNNTILNAASIRSYVNFSGDRVRYFDNYKVELEGSTVITVGSPVVLTSNVSSSSLTISASGTVSSDGGSAVTERGFVYATTTDPTITASKLVVSGTTGSMNVQSSALTSGTYYVRAFATNATGTSYGVTQTVTLTAPTRTITFDANGGTGSMAVQSANVPTNISSNSFSRTGFSFAGWNSSANGGGTSYTDNQSYDFGADVTLYAQWTSNTPVQQTQPAPYRGPLPIKLDIACIPASGATATMSGKRMHLISSASVDGIAISISNLTTSSATMIFPSLAAGSYDIEYFSTEGKLVQMQGLKVCPIQVVGEVSAPTTKSSTLPTGQSPSLFSFQRFTGLPNTGQALDYKTTVGIKKFLSDNPGLTRVTCVGSASGQTESVIERRQAFNRAMAACRLVRDLDPGIVIRIATQVGIGTGRWYQAVTIFGK